MISNTRNTGTSRILLQLCSTVHVFVVVFFVRMTVHVCTQNSSATQPASRPPLPRPPARRCHTKAPPCHDSPIRHLQRSSTLRAPRRFLTVGGSRETMLSRASRAAVAGVLMVAIVAHASGKPAPLCLPPSADTLLPPDQSKIAPTETSDATENLSSAWRARTHARRLVQKGPSV